MARCFGTAPFGNASASLEHGRTAAAGCESGVGTAALRDVGDDLRGQEVGFDAADAEPPAGTSAEAWTKSKRFAGRFAEITDVHPGQYNLLGSLICSLPGCGNVSLMEAFLERPRASGMVQNEQK